MMRIVRAIPVALVATFFAVTNAVAAPVAAVAAAITTSLPFISAAVDTIVFFAVQTAIYAGLGYVSNKLLAPKIGASQERQASILQLSLGETPRAAIFGRAASGGSLLGVFNYGGKYGTDWVVKVIALADHRCHALAGFYVDDKYVNFSGSGVVAGYNDQLVVHWLDGSAGQQFPADLLAAWQTSPLHAENAPASADVYTGMAYVVVAYKADEPDAKNPTWASHPQLLWDVYGKRCYDPRKDDTVGGSGPHRWNDPSTWEWTQNPAVCRYNWVRGIYALDQVGDPTMLLIGRGLSSVEAPPQRVFAYANLCDELVDDGDGGTEPRYQVDGVIQSTQSYLDVEEMFRAAVAGQIIQPEGGIEVEPGQAKTPIFEITDDDLVVGQPVEFSEFLSDADRINTIIPRYVEPAQKWQEFAGPVQRDEADIIADGGPREETLPLSLVTRATQAQRVGRIAQKRARRERQGKIPVGPRFAEAEDGDWIVWTSARHTKGQPVTFLITSAGQDQGWGCSWTLTEISFDDFGFGGAPLPASGGQTPTPAPGSLVLDDVEAQAIEIEGASGSLIPAIRAAWEAPVDAAIGRIRAEVRRVGHTDAAPTLTEAVNDGVMIITNGVAPDSLLEVRLVPLGGPGRPIVPSNWIAVSTGGLTATGVRTIGERTVEQWVGDFAGMSETGRQLTQTALELALGQATNFGQVVDLTFHNGVATKRILIAEDEAWTEGSRSIWWRTDGIAYVSDDGQAMILRKDSLIWDPEAGESVAEHMEALIAQVGDDIATAVTETKTWVNSSSAGALWIQSLEVAFGGNFQGSITQTYNVVSGMGATGTLVFDVNGHLSGWRHVNTGSLSSFVFLTDEFGVTDGTTELFPFAVVGGEVWATLLRVGAVFAGSIVTESLVGGAVTAMLTFENASPISVAGTAGLITNTLTFNFSCTGGKVDLQVEVDFGGPAGDFGTLIEVLCDGALVGYGGYIGRGSWGSQGRGVAIGHSPGAGTHTYVVRVHNPSGGVTGDNYQVNRSYARIVELKR